MRNADRMIRDAERARSTLDKLTDAIIRDIVRRAGSPATDTPRSGARSKGTYSDPTYSAVVRNMTTTPDLVWQRTKEVAETLHDISTMCQKIDETIRWLTSDGSVRARPTTANCEACERVVECTPKDRLRSGFCSACYQSWNRAGRPYRQTFIADKRNEKAAKTQ